MKKCEKACENLKKRIEVLFLKKEKSIKHKEFSLLKSNKILINKGLI
jgi:hypothetical protein